MEKQESLVLIDGNSLVNRAFYALPPLNNNKGIPIGAVYGFTNMLVRAILDFKPKFLAVAFDLPKPTFRHIKYEGYKATRKSMPDELRVQMPIVKEMLSTMGIKVIEKEGFEADDILGTMASRGVNTTIVTGDKDALQLIGKETRVMLTKRGISEVAMFDTVALQQEYGMTPIQFIDYKALCGDTSDNIPGVPGVGDKTARGLLADYGSLDGVYENVDKVAGKLKDKLVSGKELAYLSKELATIDNNVPLDVSLLDCIYKFPFSITVKQFFTENSFKSLAKREELFEKGSGEGIKVTMGDDAPSTQIRQAVVLETQAQLLESLNEVKDKIALVFGEEISFALGEGGEYTAKLSHTLLDIGLNVGMVLGALKPVCENEKVQKIVFDAKSLKKQLKQYGIELINYTDCKLAQYLIDPVVIKGNLSEVFESVGLDKNTLAVSLFCYETMLKEQLEERQLVSLFEEIELPLVEVLYKMEREGFKVDKNILSALGFDFSERCEKLSKDIQEIAGVQFNVNSPKQLAKVLFEDLKILYPKKGEKKFSTAADILEQLVDKSPIVAKVLDYRSLAKLNSTYVEGLLSAMDSNEIVRTDFKQMLTATGRLSSVEPNLQNIPIREEEGRLLRKAFVPKTNDSVLICADYSQIELRLMAHLSGDEKMIAAFLSGEDIHTSTAMEVFGVDKAAVTSIMRREAKAVNFGIIYGISDFGLAQNLKIARYKAKDYIDKYLERFSNVKKFMDSAVADAKSKGYAVSMFGRKRAIPELRASNPHTRGFGERVAMNMPLQGSAADIIKIAMNRVASELEKSSKGAKLILQVHDELIVECKETEAGDIANLVKKCMENAVQLKVPLVVDVGIGKSWYECK